MTNSKAKGKRGELEWARVCRDNGFKARRGQQYNGADGSADVVGLPFIHSEVKRTEALRLYEAIDQSVHDANPWEKPIVASRKNDCCWLVTMRAEDWFAMYREWEAGQVPFAEQDEDEGGDADA